MMAKLFLLGIEVVISKTKSESSKKL